MIPEPDALANIQMEPTRPMFCAIMNSRRAAHLARWRIKNELNQVSLDPPRTEKRISAGDVY
jgi:hypothetical protein